MNLSFLNVRGLNKSSKQHLVKNHLSQYHISIQAILETKINDRKLPIVARKIARNWSWISNINLVGKVRIIIMWDPNILDIKVEILSAQHITCKVKSMDGRLESFITAVYGFNQINARRRLWSELNDVFQSVGNSPWLLSGDFNSAINNEEKIGDDLLLEADFRDFSDFIYDCQLNHLKTMGCFYTWNNKQDASSRIWSRLDKTLVNDSWLHMFCSSQVEYLLPGFSDHSPALISIFEDNVQGKRPFKFFNIWTKHDTFLPTVSKIWQTEVAGFKMYSVCTKMKLLRSALKELNKRHFSNISEQVLRAKHSLEEVQNNLQVNPLNPSLINRERECMLLYNKLLDCEMSFYQQKAKNAWSIKGDRCTKFFHSIVKNYMHYNKIMALYNSQEQRITEGDEIAREFVSYKNLMGVAIDTITPDTRVICSGPCLSAAQASLLSKTISKDEIKDALFSMDGNRSPHREGFGALFFKSTWSVIGDEVTLAIQYFSRQANYWEW
ncbi:uncharacterized protein LOC109823370 [Asparagus officinalis]|uniref:uncharacterized protein LOC109823370 n=1 Tax=Asparagus officinalis TaxID=4686 RepID=UPI00098DF345|nr:uncharacterized protein LOC109823370 [Asparagus officinalis]